MATYEGPGESSAGYHYNLTDWLGTKRMQTVASGNQEETCTSLPFGDSLNCTGGADATEHHFTGKERDTESGLDYFQARYFSSNFGRWMSPDWAGKPTAVPYSIFSNPASLNLYIYVGGNPVSKSDTDGHCFPFCDIVSWVAAHIASTGIGISSTRNEYNARLQDATTPAARDALKTEMRAKGPALGRALAEGASKDPGRVAARAAKTEAELAATVSKTSSGANSFARAAGVVGKVSGGVAVGIAVYDVASAPDGKKGATAATQGGGLAGAFVGGETGAEAGAAIGSIFPGAGTAIGAAVGGIIGAVAGGEAGQQVGAAAYNSATH